MTPGYQPNIDRFKHRTAALNYLSRPARAQRIKPLRGSAVKGLIIALLAAIPIWYIVYTGFAALLGVGP